MIAEEKARGICLTLIKTSVYIRRPELRHRVERLAFELLERVCARDFQGFLGAKASLEGLINLGKTIYEVEPINAETVIREIWKLDEIMRQTAEGMLAMPPTLFEALKERPQMVGLPENPAIRPASPLKRGEQTESGKPKKKRQVNPAIQSGKPPIDAVEKSGNPALGTAENPAIRQSAIVERIRQSGNGPIKLRDIAAAFPAVSDRTIRYDLQRLSNQGIIERIGEGGYYKVRVI